MGFVVGYVPLLYRLLSARNRYVHLHVGCPKKRDTNEPQHFPRAPRPCLSQASSSTSQVAVVPTSRCPPSSTSLDPAVPAPLRRPVGPYGPEGVRRQPLDLRINQIISNHLFLHCLLHKSILKYTWISLSFPIARLGWRKVWYDDILF